MKKIHATIFAIAASLLFTSTASAQESLDFCSAEKTHQMELTRSIRTAPERQVDPYTNRSYSTFNRSQAKDEINRIDEWLWKNCRQHSEEMRKIEQQYM